METGQSIVQKTDNNWTNMANVTAKKRRKKKSDEEISVSRKGKVRQCFVVEGLGIGFHKSHGCYVAGK